MKAAAAAALVSLLTVAVVACTPSSQQRKLLTPKADVLTKMGFALTDDGDPSTPSGDLSATFDAPVLGENDDLSAAGTAHAVFDDAERDLSSATIIDAFPDVVYAVLFEADAPWRYVIVAAHTADLVAGADVALDGSNAAALVVDEETGSGYLSSAGSLHVDAADLVAGGRLTGSLSSTLVEVGLASWPESLFPFTVDGEPTEQAASSGTGTFSANYDGTGSATVSVDVAGHGTFSGGTASVFAADDQTTAIIIDDASGARSELAIFLENSSLAVGTVSLGGYVAGASLLLEDGSQVAFVDGSLTLTQVDDVTIAGSFTLTGDAYVIPADQGGFEGEGEGEEDCTGIDTLASSFAPAQVYIEENIPADQMPAGYDKALTFTDATTGMLGVLVSSDVDLHAGSAYAFSTVDFEGRPFPAAVLGIATCNQMLEIQNGTLTATLDDATQTMSGTLSYVVDGASRDVTFSVSVIPADGMSTP